MSEMPSCVRAVPRMYVSLFHHVDQDKVTLVINSIDLFLKSQVIMIDLLLVS